MQISTLVLYFFWCMCNYFANVMKEFAIALKDIIIKSEIYLTEEGQIIVETEYNIFLIWKVKNNYHIANENGHYLRYATARNALEVFKTIIGYGDEERFNSRISRGSR